MNYNRAALHAAQFEMCLEHLTDMTSAHTTAEWIFSQCQTLQHPETSLKPLTSRYCPNMVYYCTGKVQQQKFTMLATSRGVSLHTAVLV